MSAPANMQWAARPAAGQVGVGQPQGTASGAAAGAARPAGAITQQQMQQHLLAKGGATHGGLAAVGQGQQALYQPPAGYLQHGQLPAPSMPLVHRPPGAPITGSVQAQGAWRPSAPFGPPSAAGVAQQQAASHPSAGTAFAAHTGGIAPALPAAQAHVQQIDPGQTGMVTFAAEPVKEPLPSTAQQTGRTEAAARAPSAASTGATEGKTPMVTAPAPVHSQSAPQPSSAVVAVASGQAGVQTVQTGGRALPASDALAAQLPEPIPVVGPA